MTEIWKQIKNWPYSVSSLGRVRNERNGNILKGSFQNRGYLMVDLNTPEKRWYVAVHYLVANYFIGSRLKNKQINHIDGVKSNNCVSNLEFVSCKENINHAWNLGLHKKVLLRPSEVLEIEGICEFGFSGYEVAKIYGVDKGVVYDILKGRTWSRVTGRKTSSAI